MRSKKLSDNFLPELYQISRLEDNLHKVTIKGRRIGRPSRRLTFHQSGLKVNSAKIVSTQKNKQIEHQVDRINHLPSFEEVRIHTSNQQYPGEYIVELTFSGIDSNELQKQLRSSVENKQLRKLFPSIAEDHDGDAKIEL